MKTLIFILCIYSVFGSNAIFTDQPRIQTVDGHLFIYGGNDKNLTFMTTNNGFINVNGENLYNIVQDAKKASRLIKNLKYTSLNKLEDDMKNIITSLDQYSQRLSVCENILTSKSKDKGYFPMVTGLNTRVTKLERKVRSISRNLLRNECRWDPCLNGGTCFDRYLGYECRCSEGWEGKKCEKDVNECAKFAGTDLGCQNGATCVNKKGSYECICASGWYGLHCLKRSNDCSSGSEAELCGHGICVSQTNTPRGYTCICSQGWKSDGINPACTSDVDECAHSPCSRNPPVLCHNSPGSFFCGPCPPGFTGNGFQCTDVNECLVDNGGCSIQPLVLCINTFGSSVCGSCPPGYSGDGKTCIFLGKCLVDNGGCHPNARCLEIGANIQCQCSPGYTGYGIGPFGCQPLSNPVSANPCQPNPCLFGGRCYATSETNFTCSCLPGFTGSTCGIINSCDTNPCRNGGTCESKGTTFRCKCPPRYRGTLCEEQKEACGEFVRTNDGVLKYPDDSSVSVNDINCAWLIRVNATQIITITFDYFQLRYSFECQLEWLEIHDGRSTGDVTLGKFCGKSLPNNGTIITSQNYVYIWFKSIGYANTKFQLRWNATEPNCGGQINASVHGVIASPGYPGKYPNNRDCYWQVTAPVGKRIMFTIFELRLRSSGSCMNDYLEIHDGASLDSPLLVKFCNTTSPEVIETPGNFALVYFHSDSRDTEKGFQIAYHPQPGYPGCGGIFTTLLGEISSPSHNGLYLANLDCAWIIRLPEERGIKIEFVNFQIQSSHSCREDFLEIRDGADISSPLIGKFCGTNLPPPITSTHKNMFIRFYSDDLKQSTGFRLRYKSVCEQTYTAASGVIKSPGYPITYKINEECVMLIEQPPAKVIILEFQDFEMESTYNCIFDYLEIYDGHNSESPLIGRYCGGKRPGKIVSSHNYLYMKMITDHNVQLMGFYANYSTIDVSCGGMHTTPTGVINSPVEGNRYPSNSYCKWVIVVQQGEVIQLVFNKFKVEGFNDCVFDYVAVYDNNTALKGNNLIGRYCNLNVPPLIMSSDNMMTIVFASDSSFSDEGFSAMYTAINASTRCGGKFFTEWGVIKTPNYPLSYPNGVECTWIIKVKNGHKINLNISDFWLERPYRFGEKKCKFDYLDVRDGGSNSSPLIGRYCGTEIPKNILSQSNNIYLEFKSDNLDAARGFQISWDGSIKGCGGTLTGVSGSIMSPNYPEAFGSALNCLYHISVSHGSRVQLNFVDLDLEPTKACFAEYIEILDGKDIQSKSLGKFCSSLNLPLSVISTSNQMTVMFKSSLISAGKGFYLKYFTVCQSNVTGYQGIIESPNYPNNFPNSLDCTWIIKAPVGNKVSVSFTDFNLKSVCRNSYLEFKEGDFGFLPNKIIGKYCKNNKTQAIESSREWLSLHFATSERSFGGYFRLEWAVKGCGGYLTKPVGTFTSPNYPNLYPTNTECEWWITVDPFKSIALVISDIIIEKSENCELDALEVYGGPDRSSPLLTKLCSNRKESVTVTSSGNKMLVVFKSDVSNSGRGFKATYSTVPSSCGGLYTANSGSIHSRNYPNNYQLDDCEWRIQVQINHRINLTFTSFDLYIADENCSALYVEVYDGASTEYPSIWRHCGNKLPKIRSVISTSNVLTVRMKVSNTTYISKGFLATYNMICGGIINADEPGIIEGGTYLNLPYKNHCTWLLTSSEPDGHIILTLSNVKIDLTNDNDGGCFNSMISVYDGPDENSTEIGTYCLDETPLPIVSRGNQLFLKVVIGWNLQMYFKASYSSASSACGADLYSERGSFASPNYPNSFPPNSECIWTIHSAPGNRIQLSFKVFDIVKSENCNEEYVEIRDKNAMGKIIGIYCGSDSPSNITAQNSLWIKFRSIKGGLATMRFLADYSLMYGNELSGSSGQIASPGYPMFYNSFTPSISWRITVDFKKYVQIQFKEIHLESSFATDCSSSLTVYDGFDDSAPILIMMCDSMVPESPVISSSNVVYVVFTNEHIVIGSMFFLEWSETASKSMILPVAPTSTPLPNCGGEVFLSSRMNNSITITGPESKSLNDREQYYSEIKCIWKITCPEDEHLSITINSAHFESFVMCFNSYISISSGGEDGWKEIYKVCPETKGNPTVHGSNALMVTYVTSYYQTDSLLIFTARTECGGSIKKTNGVIKFDWRKYSSTNAVIQRNSNFGKSSCQWDITVNFGRTIQAVFEQFDGITTTSGVCQDQYVLLRNGGTEDSPYLDKGTYCSTSDVLPMTTSNKLFVKIVTNYRFFGFTLKFEEVPHDCGGRFTLDEAFNSTIISSPNYPNVPPVKVECIWKFVTAGSHNLQIDFLDRFDLAYSQGCIVEHVLVRDGGTDLAPELGRFCSEKPNSVRSTRNMMYVRYFTNTTDPNAGFRARVSLGRCGGTITSSSGILTSPGYPTSFPYHTECEWEIETNSMSTLKINFEDINLPYDLSHISSSGNNRPFITSLLLRRFGKYLSLNDTVCSSSAQVNVSEEISASPFTFFTFDNDLFDGPRRGYAVLASICSNRQMETIETTKNKAIINFNSGIWEPGHFHQSPRGFKLNFTSVRGGCLHKLYTESGVIEIPKKPVGQLGYYNCEWRITVPRGRRITVTVTELSSATPWSGKDFFLFAYNGHAHLSEIGSLITSNGTNVVKSTSNLMTINFVSPYKASHRYFKLSYNSDEPAVCGGNVSDSEGNFTSPKNFSSFYCSWYFTQKSKENQTLSINVYDSVIGNRTGICTSKFGSYLAMRSEGENIIHHAVFCGNISSQTIRTPFTRTVLTGLKNIKYFGDVNFNVKYKLSPCGGFISSSQFIITTPNYPDNYPNNIDCAWLIDLPFDSFVKLTFEDFQLDEKSSCDDYLIVKNGPNLDSPTIDTYCGSALQNHKPIISEKSSILIEFHSDGAKSERGFRIKVESLNSTCGGVIHTEGTEITSPNFPYLYGNNQECEWEIRSIEGMHIGLVFVDRFHIEDSPDCKKDYIKVFEYVDFQWKLLKTLCGREFPSPVNSTTNRMKILFHSDDSVVSDGFKAKWFSNCGATYYNVKSGTISSPGYPGRYPGDIHCEYIIEYPEKELHFKFFYFNLEKSTRGTCMYDKVEFLEDKMWKSNISVGKYCGSSLPSPRPIYGKAKIIFTTDTFANFNGFVLNFGIDVCGATITKPSEISYSCDKNGCFILDQHECRWNITAPPNKIIVLSFTRIDLPYSSNCKNSGLEISDRTSNGSSVMLGRLCGYVYKNLPTIHSNSNNVTLRMIPEYYNRLNGFSAQVYFSYGVDQGCGGVLRLNSNAEMIQSPDINRDGMYEESMDCNWLIFAEPFHYIIANFRLLDVDNCNSTESNNITGKCSCDFVELRNGINPNSDILVTVCGNVPPSPVKSSASVISVRFRTDAQYNRKGFSIRFSSALSECGYGILNVTKQVQTLTSPNYPDKYPLGIKCRWVLSDRNYSVFYYQMNIVHVHVLEWDLPESEDCSNGYLAIRNTGGVVRSDDTDAGLGSSRPIYIVGKTTQYNHYIFNPITENERILCGKGKAFDYYVTSNEITIDFVSKSTTAKKGFKLEYSFAGCSRNYSSDHGQIVVDKMHKIGKCEIVIEAPTKNHTISLYFSSISINSAGNNCSDGYLTVLDGPSSKSPPLEKLCGFTRPKPVYSSGQYLRLEISGTKYYAYADESFDLLYLTTDKGKGCGGRISAVKGTIFSSEYPKNIRRFSDCRWDVSVPKDMEIAIKFVAFDIGPSNTCQTDFLAIYDVSSDGSEVLRSKFCGGDNPATIRSQASSVAINYKTSPHNGGSGWEIEFSVTPPGCQQCM